MRKKESIVCYWCNLGDDFEVLPEKKDWKCPYCGNNKYRVN